MEMRHVWTLTGLLFAAGHLCAGGLGIAPGYAEEPKAEESASDAALTELDAVIALAKTDPKKAGPVLKKLLTRLSKKDAIPEGSHQHTSRYNLALTAAHRLGVRLSAKYRTKEHRAQKGMLVFDVPTRTGWEKGRVTNPDHLLVLYRKGSESMTVLLIAKIDGTKAYVFPDGSNYQGGDLKGMTKKRMDDHKEKVDVLISAKSIRSITKKLGKSAGFEIHSETSEGEKTHLRMWQTKSRKNSKVVYLISVAETGASAAGDPEADALLASMREKPKK